MKESVKVSGCRPTRVKVSFLDVVVGYSESLYHFVPSIASSYVQGEEGVLGSFVSPAHIQVNRVSGPLSHEL